MSGGIRVAVENFIDQADVYDGNGTIVKAKEAFWEGKNLLSCYDRSDFGLQTRRKRT